MVTLEKVLPASEQADDGTRHRDCADEVFLKGLVERHLVETGSEMARRVLSDWPHFRARFVKVFPNEYRRALKEMSGRTAEQRQEAA
jgi:glutamate synthase (NADPH/NADH) large chain